MAAKDLSDTLLQLVDGSPDAVFVVENGFITYLNSAALALLGAESKDQLIGSPILDRIDPKDHILAANRAQRLHESHLPNPLVAKTYLRLDGSPVQVEVTAVPFSNLGTASAMFFVRDISHRVRAEEELRRNESLLQSIIDNSMAVVFVKDLGGRYIRVNQRHADLFKIDNKDIVGLTDFDLLPAQVAEAVRSADRQVIDTAKATEFEETVPSGGEDRIYISLKFPLLDCSGVPYAMCGIATDITERKRAEQEIRNLNQTLEERVRERTIDLRRNEELLRETLYFTETIFKSSTIGIAAFKQDGLCVMANPALAKLLGISRTQLLITNLCEIDARYGTGLFDTGISVLADGELFDHDIQLIALDGAILFAHCKLSRFYSRGQPHLLLSLEDISERKAYELTVATEAERMVALLETATDAIHILDEKGNVTLFSHSFASMLGYTNEEASHLNVTEWDVRFPKTDILEVLRSMMDKPTRFETRHRRKNGTILDVEVLAKSVSIGGKAYLYASARDITQRKQAEVEIENLAFYDTLTHLPNLRLLMDRLQQALASSARSQREGALLFIDLDNFKSLNDTRGHDIGDQLLQQVSQRLLSCVREDDTVARFGGDEFVILLVNLSAAPQEAASQVEIVGEKIFTVLNQPYVLAGHEHHITPSIGVALFNDHKESTDELLKWADLAMYQAKAAGRNTLRFFDPEMQSIVSARATLESDLRKAVREQDFLLHYQPQVDSAGRTIGAEALVRWQHPERGMVSPADFIPLAEETGLILGLGQWVLETACAQLAAWSKQTAMAHLTLAVNVSPRQFHSRDFVTDVFTVLDKTGANPHLLKLELTESMLLNDVEDTIAKMEILQKNGISFSLDDFGTGFSSLSYLKRLPLDQLKIDRSFVHEILTDPNDAAIARMIVALAQSMGLSVIAEGVETKEQQNLLMLLGCNLYQGYFFNRPMPIDEFENLWLQ